MWSAGGRSAAVCDVQGAGERGCRFGRHGGAGSNNNSGCCGGAGCIGLPDRWQQMTRLRFQRRRDDGGAARVGGWPFWAAQQVGWGQASGTDDGVVQAGRAPQRTASPGRGVLPWRRRPRKRASCADWLVGARAGDGPGLAITTTKNSSGCCYPYKTSPASIACPHALFPNCIPVADTACTRHSPGLRACVHQHNCWRAR